MNSNTTISPSDQELLTQYVTQHSERAFEALIRRHGKMVYSVALRKVRQPAIAEDVTQAVFLVLVHKSASLLNVRSLGGWLHRVTCFAAIDALRREDTRVVHEREAAILRAGEHSATESAIPEDEVGTAAIDEALARLGAVDREALLLRFYQDATYSEIGIALSMSEDAARLRVTRALNGLKKMMAHRTGKGSEGAAAMVTLAMFVSRRVCAAPEGMIDRIALKAGTMSAGHLGGTTASIAHAILRRMQLYYVKLAVGIAAGILLTIIGAAMMAARQGAGKSLAWNSAAAPYAELLGLEEASGQRIPAAPKLPEPGNQVNSVAPIPTAPPKPADSAAHPSPANTPAGAKSRPASVARAAAPAPQDPANQDVIHISMVRVPGVQWVGYVFQRQSGAPVASDGTAPYELVKINLHGVDAKPDWMLDIGGVVWVNTNNPGRSLILQLARIRQTIRQSSLP